MCIRQSPSRGARLAAGGDVEHFVEVLVEAALEDAALGAGLVVAQAAGRARHEPGRRQVLLPDGHHGSPPVRVVQHPRLRVHLEQRLLLYEELRLAAACTTARETTAGAHICASDQRNGCV